MRRTLKIAVVVMAVVFACAAALAQTNAAKTPATPDAGQLPRFEHLGATKAPPMHFRDPPAQQPAPQQQAPAPKQKPK